MKVKNYHIEFKERLPNQTPFARDYCVTIANLFRGFLLKATDRSLMKSGKMLRWNSSTKKFEIINTICINYK